MMALTSSCSWCGTFAAVVLSVALAARLPGQAAAGRHPLDDAAAVDVLEGASSLIKLHSTASAPVTEASKAAFWVAGPGATMGDVAASSVDLPMSRYVATASVTEKAPQVGSDGPDGEVAPTDFMRDSVVRIETITSDVNWFRPFQGGDEVVAIGSGFAVALAEPGQGEVVGDTHRDPVFVTNAHVVLDAHTVQIQMPAVGQSSFEAYVPLIYEDFDLALVKLVEPELLFKFLADQNITLRVLPIKEIPVTMGLDVVALGFPLGSKSLILSRGVISGTQSVNNNLCFQSTAPISPGSSGGPLLSGRSDADANNLQVVGVNFAVSAEDKSQNNNYVVPAVHIRQLLHEFWRLERAGAIGEASEGLSVAGSQAALLHNVTEASATAANGSQGAPSPEVILLRGSSPEVRSELRLPAQALALAPDSAQVVPPLQPKQQERKQQVHHKLRFAPLNAIGTEANGALYNLSGGCREGVFINKVEERSSLHTAVPPVLSKSFITAVDEVPLDSFGMGRTAGFLGDPLPFENIMALKERVEDSITLSVCRAGNISKHVVSALWRPEYEVGIRAVTEPHFEPEALDFEIFGDVTVMQMALNHINLLLEKEGPETLGRWLMPEARDRKFLIIADVRSGTYASRVMMRGMVLRTLNGENVSTLSEFRKQFRPKDDIWKLETERDVIYEVEFKKALEEQLALAKADPSQGYLKTPAVMESAQVLGLVPMATGGGIEGGVDLKSVISELVSVAYARGRASAKAGAAPSDPTTVVGPALVPGNTSSETDRAALTDPHSLEKVHDASSREKRQTKFAYASFAVDSGNLLPGEAASGARRQMRAGRPMVAYRRAI